MCKIMDWAMDTITGQSTVNVLLLEPLPDSFDVIVKNFTGSDMKAMP